MKFLHTSDWHLGKLFHEKSLIEDQKHVLNQILERMQEAYRSNSPYAALVCCEFFVSDTHDGTYYNFELNCIGTLLASKRRSRNDADMFSKEELSRITRHSTLERRQIEENGVIRAWGTAICIPFDLIGLDGNALPESIKANFYKCADMAAHPHYVSWNRIDISQPDFHRPDFFGELKF